MTAEHGALKIDIIKMQGVTITTKVAGVDTQGAFALIEYAAPPYFAGFAPHWHTHTIEVVYVVSGTLACTLGENTITASSGTSILVRPGVVHTFWNPCPAPATYLVWSSPGGFERYLAELATLVANDPVWQPAETAALGARYDVFPPACL